MSSQHPNLGTTLQTRPSLLYRVRDPHDTASWHEFHRLYRRLIYGRARRFGLSHEDAEDVAQDVFKRVAETINNFEIDPGRGSFRGWLMKLTQWRIADKKESLAKQPERRVRPARDDMDSRTSTVERLPSPEEDEDEWDREWQQHIVSAAMDRLGRQVQPKHYQVFELYVRERWPVLKVATTMRINPASVYVIAHRLTRQLKAEIAKLQQQLG